MVFVQESFESTQTVPLKITRTGSDISKSTVLGCVVLPNGNATRGVDYTIGNLHRLVISPGVSEIFVNITVLPDLQVETTESFRIQMTDPYENGQIVSGDRTTVEVVILDAKKGIYNCCNNIQVVNYHQNYPNPHQLHSVCTHALYSGADHHSITYNLIMCLLKC